MPLKKTVNKSAQPEKHARTNAANTKTSKVSTGSGCGSAMKMTVTSAPTMTQRLHHRKVLRLAGKRPGAHHHHHHRALALGSGKGRPALRPPPDATTCDNSDDSGLGFDHHMDIRSLHYVDRNIWSDEHTDTKRRKLDLKVENDETNDGYCFPETLKTCKENNSSIIRSVPCSPIQNMGRNIAQNHVNSTKNISRCLPLTNRRTPPSGPVTLTTQLSNSARNGKVHLQIMCQPEQQHRARYQTEGSRGAVKDRTGNGFPIVKLIGYDKPATLQIFIGTDLGRVVPHMFYQACRVSGKNSTPCIEKKIDGTIVIEVELEPPKDMTATCDCVGILKERNVDVEHRFPEQLSPRSKKKSTKCRMVFRTTISNEDGVTETLQVCSQPIVCTQPPGVPEICKKSLTACPASGGLELFILGKNFLKDTRVVFQQQSVYDSSGERPEIIWEEMVTPDKEFLQQTHLVCVVPPYMNQEIQDPVPVRLFVISSGKNSEAHSFMFTPTVTVTTAPPLMSSTPLTNGGGSGTTTGTVTTVPGSAVRMEATPPATAPFLSKMLWQTGTPKQEMDLGMMPPPTTLVPLAQRRSSTNMALVESNSPPMRSLKTELMDESSQGSAVMDHMINENSLDMRHRFRALSESSLDVHHDDANMTMINENSIEILRRQEIIKSHLSENSNSVSSSIHNEESENSLLTAHHNHITTIENSDLKGIDLRMKSTIQALNDLDNIQPPSLATLRRFVVTEPTNMPLPTQTAQSVESYLTIIENNNSKTVVSDSLSMKPIQFPGSSQPTAILNSISQLLPAGTTGEQSILTNNLLTTTRPEMLPALNESHLKSGTTFEPNIMPPAQMLFAAQPSQAEVLKQTDAANLMLSQQGLMLQQQSPTKLDPLVGSNLKSPQEELIIKSPVLPSPPQEILRRSPEEMLLTQAPLLPSAGLLESPQTEVLKQEAANLILSQQNLHILQQQQQQQQNSAKLDALVGSAMEEHIKSPENLMMGNKSPVLSSSPQEMLIRQGPLLSTSEIIIHSPQNEIVSPSGLSPSALSSTPLPSTSLSPAALSSSALPATTLSPGEVMLTSQAPLSLQVPLQTEMLALKTPPVSVESIVINAAVDYLETQKKINEIQRMDNHLLQASVEGKTQETLINSLLDVRSSAQNRVLVNQAVVTDFLKLNQPQFVASIGGSEKPEYITQESNKSDLLAKQMAESGVASAQQQSTELKKNEEGMIPQALTNMSENDLISYINPSCFDQGTFTP